MNEFTQYLPFAVNLGFMGVGYWAGSRGPAKIWQDLTGDVADIKTKLETLNAKVTTVATPTGPVSVAHTATAPAPVVHPTTLA